MSNSAAIFLKGRLALSLSSRIYSPNDIFSTVDIFCFGTICPKVYKCFCLPKFLVGIFYLRVVVGLGCVGKIAALLQAWVCALALCGL
jgi:hypothetical protein